MTIQARRDKNAMARPKISINYPEKSTLVSPLFRLGRGIDIGNINIRCLTRLRC